MDNNEFEQNPEEQTQADAQQSMKGLKDFGSGLTNTIKDGFSNDNPNKLNQNNKKKDIGNNGKTPSIAQRDKTPLGGKMPSPTGGKSPGNTKLPGGGKGSMPKLGGNKETNNQGSANYSKQSGTSGITNNTDSSNKNDNSDNNKSNNPIANKASDVTNKTKQAVTQATNQLKVKAKEGIKQVFIKLIQSPAGPYIIAGLAILLIIILVVVLIIILTGSASAASANDGNYNCSSGTTEGLDFLSTLQYPLKPETITSISSFYGWREITTKQKGHSIDFHGAVDLAASTGTEIYAAKDGVVEQIYHNHSSMGNGVMIKHNNGYKTRYIHMNKVASGLSEGDSVAVGELIGYVGATGDVTGPHLDFVVFDSSGNKINVNAMFGITDNGYEYCADKATKPSSYTEAANCEDKSRIIGSFDQICQRSSSTGVLTYYSQNDPAWNDNLTYDVSGGTRTISSGGCGPTSMAMLVTATKQKVTPYEMGQLMIQKGYRKKGQEGFGGGSGPTGGGTEPAAFQFLADNYGLEYHKVSDVNTLVDYLKKGYYAVAHATIGGPITNGGHYIFLAGIDNDKIVIYDPNLIGWDGNLNKKVPGAYEYKNLSTGKYITGKYGGVPSKVIDSAAESGSGITIDEANKTVYYEISKFTNAVADRFFVYKGPEQVSNDASIDNIFNFVAVFEGGPTCSGGYKAYDGGDGTITCGPGVTNYTTVGTTASVKEIQAIIDASGSRNLFNSNYSFKNGTCYPKNLIIKLARVAIEQHRNAAKQTASNLGINLTQYQIDALASAHYQSPSSVKAALEGYRDYKKNGYKNGYEGMWSRFKLYIKSKGTVLTGLKKRRKAEFALFVTGDYSDQGKFIDGRNLNNYDYYDSEGVMARRK